MTSTTYSYGPEETLGDLCRDLYVAAAVARQGKLNIKVADGVSSRLRAAASNMIEDSDAELLREAAGRLETLTLRVNAQAARPRSKAAEVSRRRDTPDWGALAHAQDLEQMASASSPFSVNGHEESERRRAEVQNQQARDARRRHEEQRRQQVDQDEQPETPWWR